MSSAQKNSRHLPAESNPQKAQKSLRILLWHKPIVTSLQHSVYHTGTRRRTFCWRAARWRRRYVGRPSRLARRTSPPRWGRAPGCPPPPPATGTSGCRPGWRSSCGPSSSWSAPSCCKVRKITVITGTRAQDAPLFFPYKIGMSLVEKLPLYRVHPQHLLSYFGLFSDYDINSAG